MALVTTGARKGLVGDVAGSSSGHGFYTGGRRSEAATAEATCHSRNFCRGCSRQQTGMCKEEADNIISYWTPGGELSRDYFGDVFHINQGLGTLALRRMAQKAEPPPTTHECPAASQGGPRIRVRENASDVLSGCAAHWRTMRPVQIHQSHVCRCSFPSARQDAHCRRHPHPHPLQRFNKTTNKATAQFEMLRRFPLRQPR